MNFSDYEVQLEKQIKDIKKDIARTKHELNTLSKDDINYEFKEYSLPVDIKMSMDEMQKVNEKLAFIKKMVNIKISYGEYELYANYESKRFYFLYLGNVTKTCGYWASFSEAKQAKKVLHIPNSLTDWYCSKDYIKKYNSLDAFGKLVEDYINYSKNIDDDTIDEMGEELQQLSPNRYFEFY